MASTALPRPSGTPLPGQPPPVAPLRPPSGQVPGQPAFAAPSEPFTQAVPHVSAYVRALGQVDAQTRRLFLSLRDLGQRHREQGFLGRDDTRTLQTTQRAFDTVSRRVEADLQGARARQATARTDTERQKVYDRVRFCREFLWKFAEEHENRKK